MELEDITKEDFQYYEDVRRSGVTNMWGPDVQRLAGFNKEAHAAIIKHYVALAKKWPAVRKS